MQRTLSTLGLGLALALAAVAANATPIKFAASLSGANEAPPNASAGTGLAIITMDDDANTMRVQVSFSGLTGTTTMSHVHCCTAVPHTGTVSVATELPSFTGFPIGVTSGSYDHTFDTSLAATWNPSFLSGAGGTPELAEDKFIAGLLAGTAYLNIHTTFVPAGEIRGFPALVPAPEPGSLALLATGLLGLVVRRRRGSASA
jgi:hypothetical protein